MTLCRMLLPKTPYVSLEATDERAFAASDPRVFLDRFDSGLVIDEVLRVPELLSYIQVYADKRRTPGMYVLTGSQNFLLPERIAQSLAGRTALVTLLPFTLAEAHGQQVPSSLDEVLYRVFYPRIFDQRLNPPEALSFYVSTYVERDLRLLLDVRDLSQFEAFLRLCAGRTGQLVNLSSLGNDAGISHNTARQWLSILEASYVVKLLRPYYRNLGKRLIKTPKLYFLDTGLAAFLLSITDPRHLESHPLREWLFESLVVSELLKLRLNQGSTDNLFFFRDSKGSEVDVVLDYGRQVDALEIKSARTLSPSLFASLKAFAGLHGEVRTSHLVHGGDETRKQDGIRVTSWRDLNELRP